MFADCTTYDSSLTISHTTLHTLTVMYSFVHQCGMKDILITLACSAQTRFVANQIISPFARFLVIVAVADAVITFRRQKIKCELLCLILYDIYLR